MLLQVNESASQLDKPFVKGAITSVPIDQPKFLQHVMRFVEQGLVETLEVTQVMRIELVPAKAFDQSGDLCALLAHEQQGEGAGEKRKT